LRKALDDNSEDTRLIVTIARKGYQFTADVTVAESTDSTKQPAVQVSTAPESSLSDLQPARKFRRYDGSKSAKELAESSGRGASIAPLAVVYLASWRHFGGKTPPKSQKIMLAVLPFEESHWRSNKEYLADGPDRRNDFTFRPA